MSTKKGILNFFWEDLKSDIKFVTDVFKGKAKFDVNKLCEVNFTEIVKEYWIWYLIVVLAFCCGWIVAAAYYQGVCNQFIYDTYIHIDTFNYSMFNFTTK